VPEDDEAFLMNVDDDEEIDRMQQDAQEENIYTNRRGHNMKRETSMQ
jgi:hypothetical protein